MNELLERVDRHKPNIIMLTEIEPKCKKDQTKQIKDSEISIPNYSLFTNNNRKRGVADLSTATQMRSMATILGSKYATKNFD